MENTQIKDRLSKLRAAMKERNIDFYMIPTADFHNSEYVNDYFKVREYFCNFSGSNGTLVVSASEAGLWTDGRYFIQAEKELEGTGVTLFRMQDEGVPTILEYLQEKMPVKGTLGFDGRVISASLGKDYETKLASKEVTFAFEEDLAADIWSDRPAFPAGKIMVLNDDIAGKTFEEKSKEVLAKIREEGASAMLLTKLDDIMWLTNLRGCDVECNPVAMSYLYLSDTETVLFVQKNVLDEAAWAYLSEKNIRVEEYGDLISYLNQLPEGNRVLVDKRNCNFSYVKILERTQKIVFAPSPTERLKSMKNAVELANMEKVYLKDSVALTKFICWLKTNIGKFEMTEITVADYLEKLRREIPEFIDLSFPSISAYGENAAMMHYAPTEESHAVLKPEGLYLIDSGGQYLGGTTDVTRTIALGTVSDEVKEHYSKVAAGMLQLLNAQWIYGCTGRNLDILARQPLWDIGIDYKCGTGHGIGYILNVHEGPQNIRWKFVGGMTEAVLEAGMDISNEPGVYVEGSHGIRIENVLVAKNTHKNEYGQFMAFDNLTWVPIDMDAIDSKYMTDTQYAMLLDYQRAVYEKVSPYLTKEEAEWLKKETFV